MVTKESIEAMILNADADKRARIVGRACIALFRRQTEDEKQANTATHTNMRGFTQGDARQGSITAKYYIKHGTLQNWQVEQWTRVEARGNMRISKYWRQLDEEAQIKAAGKAQVAARQVPIEKIDADMTRMEAEGDFLQTMRDELAKRLARQLPDRRDVAA